VKLGLVDAGASTIWHSRLASLVPGWPSWRQGIVAQSWSKFYASWRPLI
jgi:hypothetical protein